MIKKDTEKVFISLEVPKAMADALNAITKSDPDTSRSAIIRKAIKRELVIRAAGEKKAAG